MPYYLTTRRGLGATVQQQIASAAPSYGVPPSLALAVAQRESGFNQAARGTSGEVGVFQLMPGTAAQLGVDPSNLDQNIQGGLTYLGQLYRQFGDWSLALEAYNGGPGNVQRGTVSSAAQQYAAAVMAASDVPGSSVDATDATTPDAGPAWGDFTAGIDWSNPLLLGGIAAGVLGLVWAVSS
jgi:soluble lytic murein transglycosylase-like protein